MLSVTDTRANTQQRVKGVVSATERTMADAHTRPGRAITSVRGSESRVCTRAPTWRRRARADRSYASHTPRFSSVLRRAVNPQQVCCAADARVSLTGWV